MPIGSAMKKIGAVTVLLALIMNLCAVSIYATDVTSYDNVVEITAVDESELQSHPEDGGDAEITVIMYAWDGRTMSVKRSEVELYESVGWNREPFITMYAPDGKSLNVRRDEIKAYENEGWTLEELVRMYALDGRTIGVKVDEVEAYKKVNWYTEPPVTMYALDGRTLLVKSDEVEAHKKVGWYTEPPVTMYALDGRTIKVAGSEVEAYEKVNWYTEPPVKMYTLDGRTCIVKKSEVEAYEKVNWYTEPPVIMYALDGRTRVVKKSEVEAYQKVNWYLEEDLSELKQIKALVIPATINYRVNGYAYSSLKGYITTIEKGTVVEYMNPDNHNSMAKAKIKLPSGTVCWVPMNAVTISKKNYTIKDILTNAEREAFVNKKGYSSKTNSLIWVNKQRQTLTLFTGSRGNWKVAAVFPVATGKNVTPTPTVVCEYVYKTCWVTESYVCDPVMSLYDGYAIHNQPVNHKGYVIDTTIGNPASAGCIRMLAKDAKTLYQKTPVKTTVVLY